MLVTGEEPMSIRAEVLVVDDESIVCERLKEHLEKSDFLVETFTDSQKAVDRLKEKNFDVVITDLKMKGPTGLDVLHFIRMKGKETQVIMITGYASIEVYREADYSGVNAFIDKPFKMEDIDALVKKAAKKAGKLRRRSAK
jgi:DNA-binding NtrC family response regulator